MSDTPNAATEQSGTVVPLHKDLRQRANAAKEREDLTLRQLAKRLDVAHPVLGRWLDGENVKDAAGLEQAVLAWLREVGGRSGTTEPFAETKSARRIMATLGYAQAEGEIVAIYGGPGTGKTRTIAHYRARYRHVWAATMSPSCSTPVPALEEIAEAVDAQATGGARALNRSIRSKVAGRGGLLIIDEAQHLSQAAIEEIRSLHDWCLEAELPVGVALVGNETVYARLTGPSRASHFAQLFSRVGMRLWLDRPERSDVRILAQRYGVEERAAHDLLERVARRPGGLRMVVKICRLAKSAAEAAVDAEAIGAAIDNLGVEV
jgi:DNA transposition AAA+ family ATPase